MAIKKEAVVTIYTGEDNDFKRLTIELKCSATKNLGDLTLTCIINRELEFSYYDIIEQDHGQILNKIKEKIAIVEEKAINGLTSIHSFINLLMQCFESQGYKVVFKKDLDC